MSIIVDYLSKIFSFGPFYLIVLSWIILWDKNTLFFYYTVGLFLDTIFNLFLKGIFKQPRPYVDPQKFNLAITHGHRFLFKNGIPYDIFGMPSGHSQSVLYSTIFMYFALKKKSDLLYFYYAVAALTMIQRIYSNNHYLYQVIVGASIGALVGYIMFFLSGQQIIGKITEKLDDFGPI
jgi:membrane-associated phospholipid phosphatase